MYSPRSSSVPRIRNVVAVPRSFAPCSVAPSWLQGGAENGALSSRQGKRRWEWYSAYHSRFRSILRVLFLAQNNAQSVPPQRPMAGPSNAPLAFNFSQLSVRLLSAPFPFMYSKFPLLPTGETVASVARPPSAAGGRVEGGVGRRR